MANFPSDERPLSDRTLKYGRNVLAVSGTMLVLAWVPDIDIRNFKPLGFEITEGGAKSMWGLLTVVVVYYFFQFSIGGWHDFSEWTGSNGFFLWVKEGQHRDSALDTKLHVAALTRRALGLDVLVPFITFILAVYASPTSQEIILLIMD